MRNIANTPLVSRVDAGYTDGIATGYMSSEAVAAFAPAFTKVPRGRRVAVGCGDERLPTEESVDFVDDMLPSDAMSIEDNYAGFYGAMLGEVAVIGAAGVALHGKDFIPKNGGLAGIMRTMFKIRGSLSTLHSDQDREGHSAHFDFDSQEDEIGCLYNGQFGEVMHLIGSEGHDKASRMAAFLVRTVAVDNLSRIFGDEGNASGIFGGFEAVLADVEGRRHFSFNRREYAKRLNEGTPAVILEGQHEPALTNGVAIDMDVHSASSPRAIRELAGPRHFRNDIARVCLEIMPALKKYEITPEAFLRAAVVGIVPVRAALAAQGTGVADPHLLPIGVYGNAREAIRFLNKAYEQQQ